MSFHYDALGRLVRRDVGGAPSRHLLWDGENLLAELDGAGTGPVAEYSYYGLDDLHALIVGGTPYYAHTDGLGNVIALTNGATLSRTYRYSATGQLVSGADYAGLLGRDRARWKGALALGDDADLYYLRNRWYEPQSGRFLSEDPSGLEGGLNPYLFADDDPISGADPTGLGCPRGSHPDGNGNCLKDATVPIGDATFTAWLDPNRYRGDAYTLWEFNLFWATAERTCGYNPSVLCLPPAQPPPPPRRAPARTRSLGQCIGQSTEPVRVAAAAVVAAASGVAANLVARGRQAIQGARNAMAVWRSIGAFWQGVRVDAYFTRAAATVAGEVAAAGAGLAGASQALAAGEGTVALGGTVLLGTVAFGAGYAVGTVAGCALGVN